MKILYVSDVYFPRINGVSTSIRSFRSALESLGHEIHLIAPDYGVPCADESWVTRVPAHTVLLDPEDRMMHLGALRTLVRRWDRNDFELVHIQTPFLAHHFGVRLARRLHVPAVATFHTHFEEYLAHYVPLVPRAMLRYAVRHFTRRQAREVDGIVVPSRAIEQLLQRYGVTTPLRIVPTGVDLARFSGGNGVRFRRQHGIPVDCPVLLFVGRLAHEKNITFLVRVLDRVRRTLPQARLVIAGEGPAAGAIRRQVQEMHLGAAVHVVGNIPDREGLNDCYRAADLFVFASHTETQGLVLLEAMALATPVVGAAILGTRDILGPEIGARIAPLEIDGFAAEVVALLLDPAARDRLAAAAPAYAAEWSTRAMAERMVQLYAGLCTRQAREATVAGTVS